MRHRVSWLAPAVPAHISDESGIVAARAFRFSGRMHIVVLPDRHHTGRLRQHAGGKDFAMWYVIQTMGGQENQVLALMQRFVDESLVKEAFIPRYEAMKRIKGAWQKRTEALIPGYVFVVTKDPGKLKAELRRVPRFTRLLGNGDVFIPLDSQEVAFVNAFTRPGKRVVELSTGIIEGDHVIILNGPLMGHDGLIRKIDRHKRLAFLEIDMLGRKKTVKLGLEIVAKRP